MSIQLVKTVTAYDRPQFFTLEQAIKVLSKSQSWLEQYGADTWVSLFGDYDGIVNEVWGSGSIDEHRMKASNQFAFMVDATLKFFNLPDDPVLKTVVICEDCREVIVNGQSRSKYSFHLTAPYLKTTVKSMPCLWMIADEAAGSHENTENMVILPEFIPSRFFDMRVYPSPGTDPVGFTRLLRAVNQDKSWKGSMSALKIYSGSIEQHIIQNVSLGKHEVAASDEWIEYFYMSREMVEQISRPDIDMDLAELYEICKHVPASQVETYETWMPLMIAVANYYKSKGWKKAEFKRMAHQISMQAPDSYNQIVVDKELEKIWKNAAGRNGLGTIFYHVCQSMPGREAVARLLAAKEPCLFTPEDVETTENEEDIVVVESDEQAADIMIERLKDSLRKADDRRIFIKYDNIWSSDQTLVDSILLQHVLRSGIRRMFGEFSKPYASMVTHAKHIVIAIRELLPVTEGFIKLLRESSIGKMCFKNGVYDFKTRQFQTYEDSNVYSMIHTGRDYFRDDSDPEFLAMQVTVREKICEGTLGDQWDMFAKREARALAGHFTDKLWMGVDGLRNSSKGTLLKWNEDSFGPYVTTIVAEHFVYRGNDNNGEEELKNKWLIPCESVRLAFSSEIKMDEEGKLKLDGVAIKKFTSGGDTVRVRDNHQTAYPMVVNSTLCMFYNALPPIYPTDALENLECYTCPYKYVQPHEMPESSNSMFRLADDSVKTTLPKAKYALDAFISIILDAYEDEKPIPTQNVLENTAEFREDAGDNTQNWPKWFKFTGSDGDFISVAEIKRFLAGKKVKMGPKLVQGLLEGYGAKKDREFGSYGIWGYKGIQWGLSGDEPLFL